jgi:hypothetical protein
MISKCAVSIQHDCAWLPRVENGRALLRRERAPERSLHSGIGDRTKLGSE